MKYILILSSILFLISYSTTQSFADEQNNDIDLKNELILIDEILQNDPNNITALNNKGSILLNIGNYSEAISYFDTILSISENNTEALNNKGIALYKQELYAQSIHSFHKSLLIDPSNEITFNNTQAVIDQLYFIDANNSAYAIITILDKNNNVVSVTRAAEVKIQPPLGYVYLEKAGLTKEIDVNGKKIKMIEYYGMETLLTTKFVARADIVYPIGDVKIKVIELVLNGQILKPGETMMWELVVFNPLFLDS